MLAALKDEVLSPVLKPSETIDTRVPTASLWHQYTARILEQQRGLRKKKHF
jgi:hypothetical protein